MKTTDIPLPVDVVVAKAFEPEATAEIKLLAEIADNDMILDIGPQTAKMFFGHHRPDENGYNHLEWPGRRVRDSSSSLHKAPKQWQKSDCCQSQGFSIAGGGGETIDAIDTFGINGSGVLYFDRGRRIPGIRPGRVLPAVAALEARADG